MIGEKVLEETGKSTGIRVLADGRIEFSFQGSGKVLGIEYSNVGTYTGAPRPDGTTSGEGQGIAITKEGEAIPWKGYGVGTMKGQGWAASWRGILFFQTASQKLARLNKVPAVMEWEVDQNGNHQGKGWEWK